MKLSAPSQSSVFVRTFVFLLFAVALVGSASCMTGYAQKHPAPSSPPISKSVNITTAPNAIIWIDEIRRGQTDASGNLEIKKVSAGGHTLRVRATGFKESVTRLIPGKRNVSLRLLPTNDQAELLFQQARK
jgi:hypothetical protein